MKKIILPLLVLILLYSCGSKDKKTTTSPTGTTAIAKPDSLLITDTSWGVITAKTDLAALQSTFGAGNLTDEEVCGPECADTLDVTKLYAGKDNEITIHWKDSAYHKKIDFIECFYEQSPYHTRDGIRIGSPLADLLKVNGEKISFSGFGWDYGGFIQSFNAGKFDKSPIGFRLEYLDYIDESLVGDTALDTDMPSVKKFMDKIKVYYLSLSFNHNQQ